MKEKLKRTWVWLKFHLFFDDFCIFLFFCLVLFLLMLAGCKSPKSTENTIIRYVDSTIVTFKDSLVEVPVPVERYVDVVNYLDTLKLETAIAKATAYADTTTKTIKGTLENKPVNLTKIVYLPSKEKIVYRDSIQKKEVPVEVVKYKTKTPKFIWWLIGCMGTLLIVAYRKYIAKLFKLLLTLI